MKCPICSLVGNDIQITSLGEKSDVECARCGSFSISATAAAIASAQAPDFGISAWIRNRTEFDSSPTMISTSNLDEISKRLPKVLRIRGMIAGYGRLIY